MKTSIKSLLIFSLLILCAHNFAQESEWKLYKKVSGVEIYTTEISCSEPSIPSQKAIILKVINTTDKDIQISWDRRVWYDGKEVDHNVKEGENHMVTTVEANSFVKGDCSVPFGALYFYLEFIVYKNSSKMTNFVLENITVKKL